MSQPNWPQRWSFDDHERSLHTSVGMASPMWTAVWFSVGLGAAYWWWSKLGRGMLKADVISALPAPLGPSPEPARPSAAGQSGEAPVEIAPPELVMAHNPPPPEVPDHPAHPTDQAIPEPPPEMLAHTPPESVGVSFKPATGFENPTQDPESVFPPVHDADGGGAKPSTAGPSDREGARPAAHAATAVHAAPIVDIGRHPETEHAPAAILATPPDQPVFDPEALATETSVAALTAGEDLDETAVPTQAIGEASPAPPPKRARKKPGTAPEA